MGLIRWIIRKVIKVTISTTKSEINRTIKTKGKKIKITKDKTINGDNVGNIEIEKGATLIINGDAVGNITNMGTLEVNGDTVGCSI